jgi:hypothetical protein
MRGDLFALEAAIGLDAACLGLFDARHVPDDVREAFQRAMPRLAEHESLYQHFQEVMERGPESVGGFISTIKGKLFEIQLPDMLQHTFPGNSWSLAENPNQPVWDLVGHGHDGVDVLVQAKMGAASYAAGVVERAHHSPDVIFALSHEIYQKITAVAPELTNHMWDSQILNLNFHQEVAHDLAMILSNHGIDLPDSFHDIIPYGKDVVLGIRLILDIIHNERDFAHLQIDNRSRIHALKALALLQRFGISAVCVKLGAIMGAHIDVAWLGAGFGLPTMLGGGIGAVVAAYLNHQFKDQYMMFAMGICRLSEDDLFYLRNKVGIDKLGQTYAERSTSLAESA